MFTYLAKLKEGHKYDRKLRLYLKTRNVNVVKYLKKLRILIIESEQKISIKNFEDFEILEIERRDFTI